MIKNNVGSDACLILTGTVKYADSKYNFYVDQTFTYEDIKKAAETRDVKILYTVTDSTSRTLLGSMSIGNLAAFQDSYEMLVFTNFASASPPIASYGLTHDSNNKWYGYVPA